jgi:catechol 2,3-dioxygenase-like lactoylglutathione lyase family enzyme
VLNVRDVAAERAFYERLGLPVIYEGEEYPDFIGFGTETVHFGIQKAVADNDPPSVLTWQIGVTDIESAIERCRSAGISFELEMNNPAPGWSYRRLLIRTPGGYRLALEGPNELPGPGVPLAAVTSARPWLDSVEPNGGTPTPERARPQQRNDRRVRSQGTQCHVPNVNKPAAA